MAIFPFLRRAWPVFRLDRRHSLIIYSCLCHRLFNHSPERVPAVDQSDTADFKCSKNDGDIYDGQDGIKSTKAMKRALAGITPCPERASTSSE